MHVSTFYLRKDNTVRSHPTEMDKGKELDLQKQQLPVPLLLLVPSTVNLEPSGHHQNDPNNIPKHKKCLLVTEGGRMRDRVYICVGDL